MVEQITDEANLAKTIEMKLIKKKYVNKKWRDSGESIDIPRLSQNPYPAKNVPDDERFGDNRGYPKGKVSQ